MSKANQSGTANDMVKVLVLYHSSHGHIETMAHAVAEGAKEAGAEVDLKRIPDTASDSYDKAETASIEDLSKYDAIVMGAGTRYGHMASPMAAFWDQTAGLWKKGALEGKIGSTFSSSGSQHGGQEMTLISNIVMMMHMGMVIVGLPYSFKGLTQMEEITGGTPYGATTIADSDGSRSPSKNELAGARYQGKHVAEMAQRLAA